MVAGRGPIRPCSRRLTPSVRRSSARNAAGGWNGARLLCLLQFVPSGPERRLMRRCDSLERFMPKAQGWVWVQYFLDYWGLSACSIRGSGYSVVSGFPPAVFVVVFRVFEHGQAWKACGQSWPVLFRGFGFWAWIAHILPTLAAFRRRPEFCVFGSSVRFKRGKRWRRSCSRWARQGADLPWPLGLEAALEPARRIWTDRAEIIRHRRIAAFAAAFLDPPEQPASGQVRAVSDLGSRDCPRTAPEAVRAALAAHRSAPRGPGPEACDPSSGPCPSSARPR